MFVQIFFFFFKTNEKIEIRTKKGRAEYKYSNYRVQADKYENAYLQDKNLESIEKVCEYRRKKKWKIRNSY